MSVLSVFNPPSASQSLYSSWVTITQQHISPGVKVCYVIFTVISASMQALMEWLSRCFSAALVKSFFQLFNFIKFFFHLSLSLSAIFYLILSAIWLWAPFTSVFFSPVHERMAGSIADAVQAVCCLRTLTQRWMLINAMCGGGNASKPNMSPSYHPFFFFFNTNLNMHIQWFLLLLHFSLRYFMFEWTARQ